MTITGPMSSYGSMSPSDESFDRYEPPFYCQPPHQALDSEMQSLPLRYERPSPSSFVRVVKRRTTANKKERRRTQSINTAFTDLRECIPNVPPDTKLSKIKTLRLATSYISYLLKVLETDGEPAGGFRAELHHTPPRRRTVDPSAQVRGCNFLQQATERHRLTSRHRPDEDYRP
ncbi:unnamed protein product, partial [Iphiclides podalirius]